MKYESLIKETEKNKISFYENNKISDLKGLCVGNTVTINSNIETRKEKACILCEELGHYHTTYGNILDQSKLSNRKQERLARAWGYERLVSLRDFIEAYKYGVKNRYELAEYLDVTEGFLEECINYYKEKHGLFCEIENYVLYFEPLGIFERLF